MIESTSETAWSELPQEWRDSAVDAVVKSGNGKTPMAAVAVIACALWERRGYSDESVIDAESDAMQCDIRGCDGVAVAKAVLLFPEGEEWCHFCDRHLSLRFVGWERVSSDEDDDDQPDPLGPKSP